MYLRILAYVNAWDDDKGYNITDLISIIALKRRVK